MNDSDSQQGTPEADATTDWQKRYTDLQSEYTRSQQENSQYRNWAEALQGDDEQAALAAAEALGLEFVEDEDGQDDPFSEYEKRIARLEQSLSHRDERDLAALQEQRDLDALDAGLGAFEQRIGRKLEQAEVQLLVSHAVVNRTEEGLPGIQSAIDLYDNIDKTGVSRWTQTKRTHVPVQGSEGEETPALDSHAERVASMVAKFNANLR